MTLAFMVLTTTMAWAQEEISGLTYNTADGYYGIGSADELTALALYSNDFEASGLTFKMTADIDLSGTNWTPIGTSDHPFKGTFLGNGYKITGLSINTDQDNAGLFGMVEDATLSGVMVENASVNGVGNCGILVGYVKSGTTNTTIEHCMTMGSVSGSSSVGGFAGVLAADDVIIRECFSLGDATGSSSSVGGFVGTITRSATISDCYSLVTAKGAQRVGGFVGYLYNDDITIERCYAAGAVDGSGRYVGAFVGYLNCDGNFSDCVALYDGIHAAGTSTAGISESKSVAAELNAAEMKSSAYFPSWLVPELDVWTQVDGLTQPLLAWSVTNGLTVYASATGNGNGSVEVTADSYAPGSIVTINAVADNNSFLVGWTGSTAYADATNATTTFALDNHRVVSAQFGKLIRTAAELQAVNDDLSGIYALANDIDLSNIYHDIDLAHIYALFDALDKNGISAISSGSGVVDWTPIGNAEHRFTGKFYGRGYKISNMVCLNNPAIQGRGLFGGTRGATLDGITVSGVVYGTTYFAGGLVGTAEGTLITNCHANCNVNNASFHNGGLAGAIAEGTAIVGCSAEGTVFSAGGANEGGLVGSCGSGTVTISDCVSSAEVMATDKTHNGDNVGGFIGFINSDHADISDCRADGYASGIYGDVGGFVGRIGGSGTVNVTNCVARVDVRSYGNNYGGFIGNINNENATISNCWCSGAVWGTAGNIGAFVGIIPYNSEGTPEYMFVNCSVYTYGPGPRLFCGSNMSLSGNVLTANDYADMTNGWPEVKKHTHGVTPISTAAELQAIAANETSLAGCYVLVDDIDFHGQTIEPIGNADTPFTGELYGQGHKISRYTVNTTEPYAGLFGNIAGGRVNGVLAEEGTVRRLQDTNTTVGVGGFAGTIQSKSLVDDCSFTGKVYNDADGKNGGFGGFVGRTDDMPAILRCYADVEAVDNYSIQPNTGGFVGDHSHGYIVDAYAIGPVTDYYPSPAVSPPHTNVGGFAGYVGAAARIANAWCSGQVSSQGPYLGAFVGQAHVDGRFTNSYFDMIAADGKDAAGTGSVSSTDHAGITGLDDMSDPDNFAGFDFVATWTIDENTGHPVFRRGQQHVTFDPAGGTCAMESHDYAIGYEYYGNNDANNGLPEPVRPGYSFVGWFDDLGIQVTNNSTVTFDTNRVLHARWAENVLELADAADNTTAIASAAASSKTYNVTLSGRTLYKDGAWNTLCLPFSMTAAQIAANTGFAEAEIRELSNASFDGSTLTLNFTAEGAVTSITAGVPCIVRWASGSNFTPTFSGVTIDATARNKACDLGDGKSITFTGTYAPVTYADENKSVLFLGGENTLYYPDGTATTTIGAFRAYFTLDGIEAGNKANGVKAFVLNFGDDETGISLTPDPSPVGEGSAGAWYDLSGRKVHNGQLPRGIYVNNGKKVVIK